MSGTNVWLEKLKKAEKTCLISDGKRKVHYTFEDKTEMAEEYNLQTGELLVRKWRRKNTLGAVLAWEFEVGLNADTKLSDNLDMMESSTNPIFTRQDNLNSFQWRIRNMIYPIDNYIVELDEQQKNIIIKTKNKKYYKKFNIPDLDRIKMGLNSSNLSFTHANNTLLIKYTKPNEILSMEKAIAAELSKSNNTLEAKSPKDGDVECKPS